MKKLHSMLPTLHIVGAWYTSLYASSLCRTCELAHQRTMILFGTIPLRFMCSTTHGRMQWLPFRMRLVHCPFSQRPSQEITCPGYATSQESALISPITLLLNGS